MYVFYAVVRHISETYFSDPFGKNTYEVWAFGMGESKAVKYYIVYCIMLVRLYRTCAMCITFVDEKFQDCGDFDGGKRTGFVTLQNLFVPQKPSKGGRS